MNNDNNRNYDVLTEDDIFGNDNDYTISGMDALEFDRYLDLLNDTHYEEDTEEERIYYDHLSTLEDNQAKYWIV